MPIQKIKSGRVITVTSDNFVGENGMIFYDEVLGDLRLGDGHTPGGRLLNFGGSYSLPPATTSTLGGIKVGANLSISLDGTLSANTSTAGVSDTFKTIVASSGSNLVASGEDILSFVAGTGLKITANPSASPYKSLTFDITGYGNIDGGAPDSIYGGITALDGGGP